MRRLVAQATGLLLSSVIVYSSGAPDTQKPVVDVPVWLDHGPPPDTPAAMVQVADAIVLARYTGQKRLEGDAKRPATAHTLEILEFLKVDSRLTTVEQRLEVVLPGYDQETPTHILRVRNPDADDLLPEETYVVFLQWHQRTNRFILPWVEDSLYHLSNGRIRSVHRYPQVNEHELYSFLAAAGYF